MRVLIVIILYYYTEIYINSMFKNIALKAIIYYILEIFFFSDIWQFCFNALHVFLCETEFGISFLFRIDYSVTIQKFYLWLIRTSVADSSQYK